MNEAGPLAGISVVEVASWVMVPASTAIMAAYGADVVKVEPAGSTDQSRSNVRYYQGEPIEYTYEIANNRKRSIQLNLSSEAGLEVIHKLLSRADVFVTNVRTKSLVRLGLDAETIQKRYPRLICAYGTGYGTKGPDKDRAAFDELGYWARGGIGHTISTDDDPPVQLIGAMGDLPTSVALLAGIMMALYRREREGRGGIVDASLYGSGMWTNAMALMGALLGDPVPRGRSRLYRVNPLFTTYRTADGKWLQFAMFQTDRFWSRVCEALERPDLVDNPRFTTHDLRCANNIEAIAEIQKAIGRKTLGEWAPLFDKLDFVWSPVFTVEDIASDEQARVNNYILPKKYRTGQPIEVVAPPFQLRDVPLQLEPSPEVGQHTEEVLLELGYTWADIEALRERGAF